MLACRSPAARPRSCGTQPRISRPTLWIGDPCDLVSKLAAMRFTFQGYFKLLAPCFFSLKLTISIFQLSFQLLTYRHLDIFPRAPSVCIVYNLHTHTRLAELFERRLQTCNTSPKNKSILCLTTLSITPKKAHIRIISCSVSVFPDCPKNVIDI